MVVVMALVVCESAEKGFGVESIGGLKVLSEVTFVRALSVFVC